jgi:hypothetical protein
MPPRVGLGAGAGATADRERRRQKAARIRAEREARRQKERARKRKREERELRRQFPGLDAHDRSGASPTKRQPEARPTARPRREIPAGASDAHDRDEPKRRRPRGVATHARDKIEHVRAFPEWRGKRRQRTELDAAERGEKTKPTKAARKAELQAELRRAGFTPGGGLGRAALGDLAEIGYGLADMAADYGTAVAKDVREIPTRKTLTGERTPFRHTGRQAARDALGFVAAAETAIPEPGFLPDWMKREIVEVDPENVSIRPGSGRVDPDDAARAGKFWRENPLLGALLVTPAVSAAARRGSRGAIEGSIRRANPDLPARQVRKIARRESRLPGYAGAHGVEGGIPERMVSGEFGTARARPYSRSPIARAGQRLYDRYSKMVEATKGSGAKWSSSQRAARMKQRESEKGRSRTEAEVARLERDLRGAVGRLGRDRPGGEALIAVLEAPRGLTPRQAIETKIRDLRETISRPRAREEARVRVAALDRELAKTLRPIVDREFPVAARQREQALRNARPRGKRAQRGIATELELTGIRGSREQGGSVLADAYAKVEETILAAAAKPDADPTVTKVAALIEERNGLRAAVDDPDVVFGEAAGDFGSLEAAPAAQARLRRQIADLEKALRDDLVDKPEFARALEGAESLSRFGEIAYAKTFPDVTPEELAARRDLVARRYHEKGLLPEGVAPEARGFFPHREEFERVGGGFGGAVGVPATGKVVGRPKLGRAFESRRNELRLYEQGRVQTNPRILSNTVRQRERFVRTQEGRRYLYEQGAPIRAGDPVPVGGMLVRNPDAPAKHIPHELRAAIANPDDFARLAAREGEHPDPKVFDEWVDSWLYRGQGYGRRPEWSKDAANVRVIPEGVVRTLLPQVFYSTSSTSIAGLLSSLGRAVTIYTPYLGTRYVVRNTAQNIVLLALTQPKAFLRTRRAIGRLRRDHPDLYAAAKAESGTVRAAAGLPELIGPTRSRLRRWEGTVTGGSRQVASKLGDLADEPWRVSSWLEYAKQYGFTKPDELRRLLNSDDAALVRVRETIAQYVRDDMLDFDALPPWARDQLSRRFFILPFRYAAAKWPAMFLRDYPTRSAIVMLAAAQHAREETPGRKTSVLESGRTEIGGREVDLGWLMPHQPGAETVEDAVDLGQGIAKLTEGRLDASALTGSLSPEYRGAVRALGYGGVPAEQIGRAFLPGYSTIEKAGRGGGVGEQLLRGIGSTIEYVEPAGARDSTERAKQDVRAERDAVLPAIRTKVDAADFRYIRRAYGIAERVAILRAKTAAETEEGEEYARAILAAESRLLGRLGVFDKADVAYLVQLSKKSPLDEVERKRRSLIATVYDDAYLGTIRFARVEAGYEEGGS